MDCGATSNDIDQHIYNERKHSVYFKNALKIIRVKDEHAKLFAPLGICVNPSRRLGQI